MRRFWEYHQNGVSYRAVGRTTFPPPEFLALCAMKDLREKDEIEALVHGMNARELRTLAAQFINDTVRELRQPHKAPVAKAIQNWTALPFPPRP